LAIAFSGIFYRYADEGPSTAAVFRCLYGLPILAAAAWWEHRRGARLDRRTAALAAFAGAFFAADLTSWHHAIEAVGAGLSTVLGNLSVLVVGIGAWLFLGERPSRRTLLALPIVLLGVVLISGVIDEQAYGRDPGFGVALGLITAVSYGGYLLVIRQAGRDGRSAGPVAISTASTAVVALVAGLGIAAAGLDEIDLVPSWPAHGWLVVYGLTSQSLGYLLISISLPKLPAVLTSIILLAQPVATVILSRILLAETPSLAQLAGVALVVGGIAAATVPFDRIREALATGRAGATTSERA
jgi:drug/metabolite transporter (DMT)-like permease